MHNTNSLKKPPEIKKFCHLCYGGGIFWSEEIMKGNLYSIPQDLQHHPPRDAQTSGPTGLGRPTRVPYKDIPSYPESLPTGEDLQLTLLR
mgnify:CR=1 FL=1